LSQSTISRVERGWFEDLSVRSLRSIFGALEVRLELAPRWRGAELERLLDEDHAAVVAAVARRLEEAGWAVALEVTYSEYGERGSIDVLGLLPSMRAAVVIEVKTDLASTEALGRKLDEKARLAARIVARRHGWQPVNVGRVVVMPESMRLRRLVQRYPVIGRMFPAAAIAVRRWLRQPVGDLAGLWFLSSTPPRTVREGRGVARHRVRVLSSVDGQLTKQS
jgi:hypothetical protein